MKINDIYDIDIIRYNNEGYGVGIYNNFVIFVKNGLVNENIRIKIDSIKKNYAYASIIKINNKNINRVDAVCKYYDICGGCNLMHMNINEELNFKKSKVRNIFKKICDIDINIDNIYSYNELNYRDKIVLRINKDKIGFYKYNTNILVDISYCYISNDLINKTLNSIRNFIKKHIDNNINEVLIRTNNKDIMVLIDNINKKYIDEFISDLNYVQSIYLDDNLIYKDKNIIVNINNLKFMLSPKSFFQINLECASNMFNFLLDNISNLNNILDLYCGTGIISLIVSSKANNVIGIESNKYSYNNAISNMKLNNINNIKFINDKVENRIDKFKKMDIDLIIVDPPRSGINKNAIKNIKDINSNNLIYISCNPISLARDYNLLKDKYEIKSINLFNMFPRTSNIETIIIFKRRSSQFD